jgi:membrane protease YdiL (CAAX protease family)
MIVNDSSMQQHGPAGHSETINAGPWFRRNLARIGSFVVQLVSFNALALLTLGRISGIGSPQLPGITLLAVGGLLMVSALEMLLEAERLALVQGVSPPRSLAWRASTKALQAAAFGTVGALPTAAYLARSLASSSSAVLPLSYGAGCIFLLAFLHVPLWMRRIDPSAPAGASQRLLRLAQVAVMGVILKFGFGSLSEPDVLVPLVILAVAFAVASWHALPEGATLLQAASATRRPALTAAYALGTLFVLGVVRAFVAAVCTGAGASPANATALGFIVGGVGVLGGSLFGLWIREVPALREQLGFGPGKGWRVILHEALLCSVPAILFNQAYWAVVGQSSVVTSHSAPAPAPIAAMTVLASSPLALVSVGVVAAPLLEELLFRGMLHRTLRTRWAVVPSVLLSSVVFLADHTLTSAIPVLVGSVCFTLALERSRSIYSAMLAHALYNGVLVLQLLAR